MADWQLQDHAIIEPRNKIDVDIHVVKPLNYEESFGKLQALLMMKVDIYRELLSYYQDKERGSSNRSSTTTKLHHVSHYFLKGPTKTFNG